MKILQGKFARRGIRELTAYRKSSQTVEGGGGESVVAQILCLLNLGEARMCQQQEHDNVLSMHHCRS